MMVQYLTVHIEVGWPDGQNQKLEQLPHPSLLNIPPLVFDTHFFKKGQAIGKKIRCNQ